jgi:hypothetical protein
LIDFSFFHKHAGLAIDDGLIFGLFSVIPATISSQQNKIMMESSPFSNGMPISCSGSVQIGDQQGDDESVSSSSPSCRFPSSA